MNPFAVRADYDLAAAAAADEARLGDDLRRVRIGRPQQQQPQSTTPGGANDGEPNGADRNVQGGFDMNPSMLTAQTPRNTDKTPKWSNRGVRDATSFPFNDEDDNDDGEGKPQGSPPPPPATVSADEEGKKQMRANRRFERLKDLYVTIVKAAGDLIDALHEQSDDTDNESLPNIVTKLRGACADQFPNGNDLRHLGYLLRAHGGVDDNFAVSPGSTITGDLDTVDGQSSRDPNAVADDIIEDITASWSPQRKFINKLERGGYVAPFVPYELFQPVEDAELHELARWAWGIENEEDVKTKFESMNNDVFDIFREGLRKLESIRFHYTVRYWAVLSANDLGPSVHPIAHAKAFWGGDTQKKRKVLCQNYIKCMFFGKVTRGNSKKRDDTRVFGEELWAKFGEDYTGKKSVGECEL